nr:MAG TPA: hypothetical protein [Caudoviricetes sp.]
MDGAIDLSACPAGEVAYSTRALSITLERSDGTRDSREATISALVNALDGVTVDITPPDGTEYRLRGRVRVAPQYSDLAHAQVIVSATCDPWRRKAAPTVVSGTVPESGTLALNLPNERRPVVPSIQVSAAATITFGGKDIAVGAGTHRSLDIRLAAGNNAIAVAAAAGTAVSITYQEAAL